MGALARPTAATTPSPRWRNGLLSILGWRALILQQDPPTWDRWRWVQRNVHPGAFRTLDAGSGSGAFAIYCATQGHEVLGLSFDTESNRLATERAAYLNLPNVRFTTGDLRELDRHAAEFGVFDLVMCLETIEHIKDDAKLLRDITAVLPTGGVLLLTTPSLAHRPLRGEVVSDAEDGGHVRFGYAVSRLRGLFREAGLDLIGEEYLSGVVTQSLTNLSRLLCRLVGPRVAWVLTFPLRILLPLDRPLSRVLRYPPLAVAVIGVKL